MDRQRLADAPALAAGFLAAAVFATLLAAGLAGAFLAAAFAAGLATALTALTAPLTILAAAFLPELAALAMRLIPLTQVRLYVVC